MPVVMIEQKNFFATIKPAERVVMVDNARADVGSLVCRKYPFQVMDTRYMARHMQDMGSRAKLVCAKATHMHLSARRPGFCYMFGVQGNSDKPGCEHQGLDV